MTTIILFATDERQLSEVIAKYPGRRIVGRVINGQPMLVVY